MKKGIHVLLVIGGLILIITIILKRNLSEKTIVPQYTEEEELPIIPIRLDSLTDFAEDSMWMVLGDLKFDMTYDSKTDMIYQYPIFSEKHKRMEGSFIELEGYLTKIDADSDSSTRSLFLFEPNFKRIINSCSFPPLSNMIEIAGIVEADDNYKAITIRGKLKLNATDMERLAYILEEVEVLEEWY